MDSKDYLFILKALEEIPFPVGKKLLIDFMTGNEHNESVNKHRLFKLKNFGSLVYEPTEVGALIDNLVMNNLIKYSSIITNKFLKVIELTDKGRLELENPVHFKKKMGFSFKEKQTIITEADREIFAQLETYLSGLNDQQKKAVISNSKKIICIAGAGCGKTTVLTRRIEFLISLRSIRPEKILAITFTRKARQELVLRLAKRGAEGVMVETFNSFCEKTLRHNNNLAYTSHVRLVSYGDKIRMFRKALADNGVSIEQAVHEYYSGKKEWDGEHLAKNLMNDCYSILDYYKIRQLPFIDFSSQVDYKFARTAKMIFAICSSIQKQMKDEGLRDFSDQLVDTINLFLKHPELIPQFDHVLVDEYQDVNAIQVKLLDIFSPKNLFCVGDPRQSIFGWRGSDIRYILDFHVNHPDCDIITLTKNYRSTKHIVSLINESVRSMGMPDLHAFHQGEKNIKILKFDDESSEFKFIIQTIYESEKEGGIFVLARTNKQLKEISERMKERQLTHLVRNEDSDHFETDQIVLATIHAIKGLEAKKVFVVGCTPQNFPCRASDHPIIDMVASEQYDKEEEERRLFYVALSRAKESLYISYSGKSPTSFITDAMHKTLENRQLSSFAIPRVHSPSTDLFSSLKMWRRELSEHSHTAAYLILHDSTLIEIASRRPVTTEELHDIKGLGPAKIRRYGDDILRIVNGLK